MEDNMQSGILLTAKNLVAPFTCATCVEMTLNVQEMGQELMALRRSNLVLSQQVEELRETNLILGRRNRVLQRRINALQDQADAIFLALCEQNEGGIST
jgi:cell division protein FtsB